MKKGVIFTCASCMSPFEVREAYVRHRQRCGLSLPKFCSSKCCGMSQKKIVSVFNEIVAFSIPEPNSGCWIWTGTVYSSGYGRFSSILPGEKSAGAHRASYIWFKGAIPIDRVVMHSCDNPLCVNPDHLSLGTPHTNKIDSVRKRRHAFGERQGTAIATDQLVKMVRDRLASGVSQSEVARAFGLTHNIVWRIAHNVTWKHVP